MQKCFIVAKFHKISFRNKFLVSAELSVNIRTKIVVKTKNADLHENFCFRIKFRHFHLNFRKNFKEKVNEN
jgi:hypothetical protein